MKKIGIDVRLLFQTGVGTYLQNLLHYLPLYIPDNTQMIFYCLPQDAPFIQKEAPHGRIRITTALWHSWKEQTELLSLINRDTLDLMHFTYFGHPILYRGKSISTIHDVTPLLYKTGRASTKNSIIYWIKYQAFSYALKNQIDHSTAIITPTRTVKEQLQNIYGVHIQNKITPIYEGVSYRLTAEQGTKRSIEKPYFLYVGNFYPHKNVIFLIRAFAKSNSKYLLVLAGPHDYFLKRILATLTSEEKKYILIKEKQSLSELATLYTYAEALIHPSISEGFGLPLVEALYFNIPIIASCIPVFQELLGDSYYSFDPYCEQSFIRTIHQFEGDNVKKKSKLKQEFSFQEMAKKTVDLYMKYA